MEKKTDQHVSEPLSRKVVKGGLWVFGLRIINRGLSFIRTIILARLLAPEDFGLFGIAMLAIYTLEALSQTGFGPALIQKKENVELYLDTAWTVSVLRAIVLFLILFFTAPIASEFFNSPQTTLIIRVVAISTLLSGFRNIGIIFFRKELEFHKQFFYEFSAALVDLAVAITLAFILRNVWAIIWGGLAANLVSLLMSYVLHDYRPKVSFQKDKFRELFGFGKWVLTSSILVFLVTQGDDIFVGRVLGITALGLYQMAYTLSNLPATEITHVISQVTFPAYSKLQDRPSQLKEAYVRVLQLTSFLSFPLAAGIVVLAPHFIPILIGNKWLAAVPALQILAFAGLTRSIAATAGYLFYALGRTKIDTILQVIRLTLLISLIYPLSIQFDLIGVSLAVLVSIFVSNIGFTYMAAKLTHSTVTELLKVILIPMLNSTLAALVVVVLHPMIGTDLQALIILVLCGTLVYLLLTYLSDRLLNYRIIPLTTEILSSLTTP